MKIAIQSKAKWVALLLLLGTLSCHAAQTPVPMTLDSLFSPIRSGATNTTYIFSGPSDTVNYLQFCNLGNNCNSGQCTGQYLTITTGTPLSFGTPYHLSTQFFTNYLQANGVNSGTYYVGMYAQSTHWNCDSNTKYCGANTDTIAQPLCVEVAYNGSTVTSITQHDSGNVMIDQPTAQYAYVADFNGNLYQCSLNNDGAFLDCPPPSLPTGVTGWQPAGITFATVNGTQYAYVADGGSPAVYQCLLNATGALTSCSVTPSSAPWNLPQFIAFTNVNGTQYAYVIDDNHDTYVCRVNSNDGSFDTCTQTLSANTVEASVLTFTTVVNSGTATQYAYIAALDNGVQRCEINNGSGELINCNSIPVAGVGTGLPKAIAIATVGSTQYAYVATDNVSLYKCTIDNSGAFNSCGTTFVTTGVDNIWVTTVSGTQYAYVTHSADSEVDRCIINASNGILNSCTPTPNSSQVWNPYGVTTAYTIGS